MIGKFGIVSSVGTDHFPT